MNALRLPSNDQERMQLLNRIYAKGLSTPKNELAFSPELLTYLRPFIAKLRDEATNEDGSAANLGLVRRVVDELIGDICTEVEAACLRMGGKRGEHLAADYGLQFIFNPFEAEYFRTLKVA
ncbi:MAG: hypothetical protein K9J06_01275 [Flavobacteriales bacterium]|nr:hypothetical protein [Flavobacteriales bacterium]